VSVPEEAAESVGNPEDPSAPGKEAPPGSIRAPPGDPTLQPGQAGRVKILQKAAVDPIRGSGISSSLSLSL
jgi:hypothetical protein